MRGPLHPATFKQVIESAPSDGVQASLKIRNPIVIIYIICVMAIRLKILPNKLL